MTTDWTSCYAIHPHTVRDMERKAFSAGFSQGWMTSSGGGRTMESARDLLYPSLTPPEPPPLVLSTGTWTRDKYLCWGKAPDCRVTGFIATASDARALADWLAKYGTEAERG